MSTSRRISEGFCVRAISRASVPFFASRMF